MINENKNNIYSLPQHDVERIAHATTGIKDIEVPESQYAETEPDQAPRLTKRGKRVLGAGAAAAAAGILLNWINPGISSPESPSPEQKNLVEASVEAAHIPVDFESETVIIKVNSKNATPAEAFYGKPEVQAYMVENPDEKTSLEASINSLRLNESGKYGIVEIDVDSDGDTDAVAKPILKE